MPREISEEQLNILAQLGGQVVAMLELRRHIREARALRKESEAFFSHSLDAMCVASTDGFFKRVNPALTQALGFSADELMAESFASFIHPEDVAGTMLKVESMASGALTIDFENRFRCLDGSYRLFSWRAAADQDTGLLYAVARDITDTRAAEQAAREQTTLLIEAAPSAMVLADEDGTIQLINRETERMFGYTRVELIGSPVHRLVPATARQAHPEHVSAYAEDPTKRAMGVGRDLFGERKDGTLVPIEIGLNPVQTATGRGVLAGIVDISERKTNERYVSTQLDVLKVTAEATDPDIAGQRIVELVAPSLGWRTGELWRIDAATNTLRATAFWSDRDRPVFAEATRTAAMAPGQGVPGTVWATGKPFWVKDITSYHACPRSPMAAADGLGASVGFPIMSDGVVVGVLEFFSNRILPPDDRVIQTMGTITGALGQYLQRAAAEEAMAAAQLAAERANASKSMFLANMSHEIRTPMNAVIGLTHLALRTAMTDQQRDYLDKISTSARSLLVIINDILDFSKIEAGRLEIEAAPFSVAALLDGLGSSVSVKADEKALELIFDLAADVPEHLVGDKLRLQQVLTNLCSNAIKFTEQGEVVVRLSVTQSSEAAVRLRCSVRDTGIGMDDEQVLRLFQSFGQADASISRKYGGTGLGLAISRRLIELMGGQIEVRSETGAGSEFWFEVDLAIGDASDEAAASVMQPGLRAIVVDDNSTARQVFQEMLSAWRMEVAVAGSGPEAIAEIVRADALETPFDVVILDWKMPGMDGLDVARRIQRMMEPGRAPTIVMATAHRDAEMLDQAEEIGVRCVLAKPVNRSVLFDALIAATPGGAPASNRQRKAPVQDEQWRTRLRGAKVLLAEDNEINQQIAVELLNSVGVTVVVVANGAEALARISVDVDAVLMDLQMPVMDGMTATGRILARPDVAHIPIIAMTANAMVEDRAAVMAAGMKDFVAKPVEPEVLYAALARHLPEQRHVADDLSAAKGAGRRVSGMSPTRPAQPEIAVGAVPAGDPARTSPEGDPPATLPQSVAGIDLTGARRRLAGNDKLLMKLLMRFIAQQADVERRIRAHLDSGDNQTAVREAHTLKGLAGNLGIDAVARAAELVEAALVERRPCDELVTALGVAVEAAVNALRSALG